MSEKIIDLLTRLALVTKGQSVDTPKFLAYAADLCDIPPDELAVVCREIGRNGDGWFPTLAEIRTQWTQMFRAHRIEPAWEFLARTRGLEFADDWRQANHARIARLLQGDVVVAGQRPALKAVS